MPFKESDILVSHGVCSIFVSTLYHRWGYIAEQFDHWYEINDFVLLH